jgi:hypothetical protein
MPTENSQTVKPRWWKRRRVWIPVTSVILLLTALWFLPRWLVTTTLGVAGVEMETEGKVRWLGFFSGWEGEEVKLGEYGRFDRLTIRWNWWNLLVHQEIELMDLDRPGIWTGRAAKAFAKEETPQEKVAHDPSRFSLGLKELRISRGKIVLEDLGFGLPAIPIRLGDKEPLVLKNLRLGDRLHQVEVEQRAEITDITVPAPYDPISPVLYFQKITLVFTWEGLARNEIRQVLVEGPQIFLGPNLFEYTDEIKKERQDWAKPGKKEPWLIQDFTITGGKLTISGFGEPTFDLPITYGMNRKDWRVGDLIKMVVAIYDLGKPYPEYQFSYGTMQGDMQFSLPPSDEKANNLVSRIYVDSLSWKDITSTDNWVSTTFDRQGIYAEFGGKAYDGYIKGGFFVYFKENFPWEFWVNSDKVNAEPVAVKLTPEYLHLTGRISGNFYVKALARDIQSCKGDLQLLDQGKLEIRSIDEILKKLPSEWPSLKRQMSTSVLSAFRDYDYTSGLLNLNYVKPVSTLLLDLQGAQGRRRFDLQWHQLSEPEIAERAKKANVTP